MSRKTTFSKPIGIVGGAGPMASSFLYRTIIEICQTKYKADDYKDFPEIILVSYPFSRTDRAKVQQEISLCFSKLKAAGAALFCIASNSFHGFLPDISGLMFVNLVEEGLKEANTQNISKALILAAQGTIDLKLYEQNQLQCLYPSKEEQLQINRIIREVAGGTINGDQAIALNNIISANYKQDQFDGIILACTELPLIHQKFSLFRSKDYPSLPIIDTVETLAKKLVELAL
jgi:aspartate racemase